MAKTPQWQVPPSTEAKYRRQLRKIADNSGSIVEAHIGEDGMIDDIQSMMNSADLYAQAITPWANRVAASMIESVEKTNSRYWKTASKEQLNSSRQRRIKEHTEQLEAIEDMDDEVMKSAKKAHIDFLNEQSKRISEGTARLFESSNITPTLQALQQANVKLIQSLPLQAAQRAKDLSEQAVTSGQRADVVADQIQDATQVTRSRADLISRTEVAKTNANITQARAGYIGSGEYIWRTMEDGAVRPSHQDMANTVQRFDSPPEVEGEGRHGPGDYPNCRCYAEVIIK